MKKYLVKKDVNKPNSEDNWIIMTGQQFHQFLETEDGQRRKKNFATMAGDDEAPTIIIECTSEQVKELDAERKREKYRLSVKSRYKHVSLNSATRPGGGLLYEEVISDGAPSSEDILIEKLDKEMLYQAIEMLTQNEKEIISALFLGDSPVCGVKFAALKGVSEAAIRKTKKNALKKLKIILGNLGYQGSN